MGSAMTKEQLEDLAYLIEKARAVQMTAAEIAEQRKSFAYGNSAFENPMITKEMVEEEALKLAEHE
jgi:hypothetical protein